MIFGDPERFAVEIHHEPAGPEWRGCGRMCQHLSGFRMGDIEDRHCSLFNAVDRFRELIATDPTDPECRRVQSLWDDAFSGLDDEQVFALLDRELFAGPSIGEPPDAYRFDFLTNSGEMFDRSKSFIVCDPDSGVRILFQIQNIGDEATRVCLLGFDEFVDIAERLVQWLDDLPDPAVGPFFPVDL